MDGTSGERGSCVKLLFSALSKQLLLVNFRNSSTNNSQGEAVFQKPYDTASDPKRGGTVSEAVSKGT